MRVDLHNHTPLCNHATGSISSFIEKAISLGIDVYGFADHGPMDFEPEYRMTYEQQPLYEKEVLEAKSFYKDKIEILLGYEVDFLPPYTNYALSHPSIDYLIGSVHFIDLWGFDNPEYLGSYTQKDAHQTWKKYFELVVQMAKTKEFQIVGHIDLLKVFNLLPCDDILTLAQPALEAIKEANMAIELNPAGWRKPVNEQYPSREILELAYQLDIPITFGSDAHSVDHVGFAYERLKELAHDIGYTHCAFFRQKKMQLVKF
jgi:histidinol-phosphatase (PHP family)